MDDHKQWMVTIESWVHMTAVTIHQLLDPSTMIDLQPNATLGLSTLCPCHHRCRWPGGFPVPPCPFSFRRLGGTRRNFSPGHQVGGTSQVTPTAMVGY